MARYSDPPLAAQYRHDLSVLLTIRDLLQQGPHGAITNNLEAFVSKWAQGNALANFLTQIASEKAAYQVLMVGCNDAITRVQAALTELEC